MAAGLGFGVEKRRDWREDWELPTSAGTGQRPVLPAATSPEALLAAPTDAAVLAGTASTVGARRFGAVRSIPWARGVLVAATVGVVAGAGCGRSTHPVCGDGYCDVARGERDQGCSADCTTSCGDGLCASDRGEDVATCAADCGWAEVVQPGVIPGGCGCAAPCAYGTVAVRRDGSIWTLGTRPGGCAGEAACPPTYCGRVQGLHRVQQATYYGCGISGDGRLYCWGRTGYPDHAASPALPPEPRTPFWDLRDITVGGGRVCGANGDGTVQCLGSAHDSATAGILPGSFDVQRIDDAVVLAMGPADFQDLLCALQGDGTVWCWGPFGTLERDPGLGVEIQPAVATRIPWVEDATDLCLGGQGPYPFACAVLTSGEVACWWGMFSMGEAPDPPKRLSGIGDAVHVECSMRTVCVLHASGEVSCLGDHSLWGFESPTLSEPVPLLGMEGVTQLALGQYDAPCSVLSTGEGFCIDNEGAETTPITAEGWAPPWVPFPRVYGRISR